MALMATGLPNLVRKRRNCAPRYVSLCFKLVAAVFKAVVSRLLVGNRPLPMIFSPLTLLSGQRRSQETKWFSVRHVPARLADHCRRGHHVDAVNPGQIDAGHAE